MSEGDDSSNNNKVVAVKEATVAALLKAHDIDEHDNAYLSKKVVLDEDTYEDAIGEIIERDFFPHHRKMKFQKEYLNAIKQGDTERQQQLIRLYQMDEPTPMGEETGQTPKSSENGDNDNEIDDNSMVSEHLKVGSKPDTKNMSLNKFFSNYVCEDDASFEVLMAKEKKTHKEKNSWLYDTQNKTTESHLKALENGEENSEAKNPLLGYVAKNALMFVPKTKDSIHSKEMLLKMANTKTVYAENTRLHYDPFKEPQPLKNNKKKTFEEIERKRLNPHGIEDQNDDANDDNNNNRQTGDISKMKELISPSPAAKVYDSPVMTWGSIEDTPLRLEDDVDLKTGPSYNMPKTSSRGRAEAFIHNKAAENRKIELRKKNRGTPRSGNTPSIASMSPAAQRLMGSTLKKTDKSLRASFTPGRNKPATPLIKGSGNRGTPLPKKKTSSSVKRNITPRTSSSQSTPKRRHVTDDLWDI